MLWALAEEQTDALWVDVLMKLMACRIGRVIIRYNSTELSRVDPQDSREMWTKVKQLTGHGCTHQVQSRNPAITAKTLNEHYA